MIKSKLTLNIADISKLKSSLDILIEHDESLVRSIIIDNLRSDDEYQRVLIARVVEHCFPQYLNLVQTIINFS